MPSPKKDTTRKFNFPILQRIKLSHFSLYSLTDTIEFDFKDGIICLAGANGLGKSTFLQVVCYGITGVVPKPSKKFVSVDDYYRDIRAFTREYFDGRLLPEHLDIAEIELEMRVGQSVVILRRGFVESESLRNLKIQSDGAQQDYIDESPEKRHQVYEDFLTQEAGLQSFRELVFLHSFVLTFDERRHLLFWDPKVLETCLLIFLGVEKDQRSTVERLRRESEKAESRVRNLTYDIKQTKDRLAEIEKMRIGGKESKEDSKTYSEYKDLVERLKETAGQVALVENKIRDAKLAIADSAARASALRNEYSFEFTNRMKAKKSAVLHPFVQRALSEEICAVCGATGRSVTNVIKKRIAASECPLCSSDLQLGKEDPKMMSRLKELDAALSRERKLLDSQSLNITRLEVERLKRVEEHNIIGRELNDFEAEHEDVVKQSAGGAEASFADLRKVYEGQIRDISRQRDDERDKGRKIDHDYRVAQKKLEQQYLNAREGFVPIFNSLAELFLGVDLDITLETQENVTLVLEIKKRKRRAEYQLSESQRFFIDIALRMAFAQFISSNGAGAPLYIDTPEGSLDLAYEAQAGQMIAKFASEGHKVLMTANINTSQLLASIASNSKKCGFGIQRLYRWTEMSAVQERQEANFDKRLNDLEKLAQSSSK